MRQAPTEVSRVDRLTSFGRRVFLFVLVGLPAFLLAIPLNWFLVEQAGLAKPVAYLIVLLIQVSINFFMTRRFVFSPTRARSARTQFVLFMAGIMAFRGLDWLIYSLAVENIELANRFYLAVQAGNVILFAVLKFLYSKLVFEGAAKPRLIEQHAFSEIRGASDETCHPDPLPQRRGESTANAGGSSPRTSRYRLD